MRKFRLTNELKCGFLFASKEMKTSFVKLMQHTPANGWMAICQRDSRPFGIVGTNF